MVAHRRRGGARRQRGLGRAARAGQPRRRRAARGRHAMPRRPTRRSTPRRRRCRRRSTPPRRRRPRAPTPPCRCRTATAAASSTTRGAPTPASPSTPPTADHAASRLSGLAARTPRSRSATASWERFSDGRAELSVAAATTITVRRDDCCESETITVNARRPPARSRSRCSSCRRRSRRCASARASRSRSASTTARPASACASLVPFNRTLSKKNVKVEFVIGDTIDVQEITVKPQGVEGGACAP